MLKLIKNKVLWIVTVTLILILVMITATSSDREEITFIEQITGDAFAPLQRGMNELTDYIAGFNYVFTERRHLMQEIDDLRMDIQELKIENQQLKEFEAEVIRLRQIVEFIDDSQDRYDFIPARVIARSPNNWYKTLTINKGAKHGIEKNMAVINADGLVGRVMNVSNNNSQVYLITDREIAVGSILQETRETNGIVEGTGDNLSLRMVNIPYYSDVEEGDRVITSGLSEIYPKGILIGYINKITTEPNGLLLSASVIPAVAFDKLEEVLVINDYAPLIEEEEGEEE
ncbi:Rod shape-determining protein MreC [Candidatus Syntrophocurvum alkaliphilum]|uniref:Cell shape-determining protein MreC n=1 Tax=Candidatus Syntrophocurvum alkaliphilum TaxID=2293317 RepID=A0A6I6DGA2_9FIRM|nr:rod shape-determining protein MreC [Candidatus Syntrophocurvum alkaliphilum]QGU00048.1 Rod shape-determining protein MreC [Candidatus Syntrophocurvum alkaliphilum]